MAIESTTPVRKAVFNPERDGQDNSDQRTLYGQVLRFPSLPPAHSVFEGVTVFDMTTKNFYECQHIQTTTEDYYEWVAVTFGAARVFLIPVGKLTEMDIKEYTDKSRIECVAKTINEIINGFIRYHIYFGYLGYTNVPAGSMLQEGTVYYGYKTNDEIIDITGEELHKVYTGEVVKLTAGDDYIIGENVLQDYTFFTKAAEPDMTNCVNRLNEIIALLNKHFANIDALPTSPFPDYATICRVLNKVVEEVDPFAVPWQVVINRIWHLEQKVGNGNFVPNEDDESVDFAGVWYLKSRNHEWLNVSTEVQDALKYATVCQINDTIFKIIQDMDGRIGDLITFLTSESETYGYTFDTLVDYLQWVVAQIPELQKKLKLVLEGIRQLRASLGDLGYIVVPPEDKFDNDTVYYRWNDELMFMETMVAGSADPDLGYNIDESISDWCDDHGIGHIYTFSGDDTAEALIKTNAFNIAVNAKDIASINAILGTTLGDKFYIETLTIPVDAAGNVDRDVYCCIVDTRDEYGAKKGTTFVKIDETAKGYAPSKTYEELYKQYGPLFVLGTPSVVCDIVEMNNREIAALNRRLSARITNIEENMNVRAESLKELTGVEGNTKEVESWHVDGYKKVILPCSTRTTFFEPYIHYYKKVAVDEAPAEYKTHFIIKWKVTTDTNFKAGKKYYRPDRIPPYNEPNEDNWILLKEGVDYKVGDPISFSEEDGDIIVELQETYSNTKPLLFVEMICGTDEECEAGTADYCLPAYILTKDVRFDSSKTYYKKNVAGSFYEASKGTYSQYKSGSVSYWVDSYHPTADKNFLEGKEYYVEYSESETGFYKLIEGEDYLVGDPTEDFGTVYEFGSQVVPDETFYEYSTSEYSKINRYSNVWVRDRRWKEYNTHRGLIDRNTDDIINCQIRCGKFHDWTTGQIKAIKDFMMYMMLTTLEIITQENSTFSLLHNTTAKLINILNAMAKLEGKVAFKHADGVYDAAYDYYRAVDSGFVLIDPDVEPTFIPGKTYYIKEDGVYKEAIVIKYDPIPAGMYYEPREFVKMIPDEDFEIGLEVVPCVYSVGLVMPTVENYTMTEIKDAVNRILRDHMADTSLPTYTALPVDQYIQENIVYYRYVDDEWERIVPEVDDPDMVGQLIKDYDPEHVWYLKMDEEIADDNYTMTWIRVMLNEMIRLYNRGVGSFNEAFSSLVAE